MKDFYKLFSNSGTSEGVRKSWAARHGGEKMQAHFWEHNDAHPVAKHEKNDAEKQDDQLHANAENFIDEHGAKYGIDKKDKKNIDELVHAHKFREEYGS